MNNSANPNPTKLLFNDSVHPTETGQQLIADYANGLPLTVVASPLVTQLVLMGVERALGHNG